MKFDYFFSKIRGVFPLNELVFGFFFKFFELAPFFLISKAFVCKLKEKKKIPTKKPHISKNFLFNEIENKQNQGKPKNYLTINKFNPDLIGKPTVIKGIVLQIYEIEQQAFTIIVECNVCKNIFYCFLDSFFWGSPFLCVRYNCQSRNFLFHGSKILTILWRKFKLKESSKNKKKFSFESIDVEYAIFKRFFLSVGIAILIRGTFKILTLNDKRRGFLSFRNFFGLYIHAETISRRKAYETFPKIRNFLTKLEFDFINKLHFSSDIFNICLKSMNYLFQGHEGCIAAILLSLSQNELEKKYSPVSICFLICENFSDRDNFLRNVAHFSSKGFYIYENSKKISEIKTITFRKNFNGFNSGYPNICSEKTSNICIQKNIYRKNPFLSIEYEKFQNLVTNFLADENIKSPLYVGIKIKKNFPYFDEFSLKKFSSKTGMSSFLNLFFILSDSNNREKEKLLARKNLKKFKKKKGDHSYLQYLDKKRNGKKESLNKDYLIKNNQRRFSSFFLRRYLNYIKLLFVFRFSDRAMTLIINYYRNFKNFIGNKKASIGLNVLEIITQLSTTKTKIDLRKIVTENDVIDVTEIFSDSKVNYRKNWENFMSNHCSNNFKKSHSIYNFLKLIKKNHDQTRQSFFDLEDLGKKIGWKISKKHIEEMMKILIDYGCVEKTGKKFFKIANKK